MGGRAAPWTWAAAGLAGLCAIALAVVAVDVLRTPGQLADDDSRFQTDPKREPGLWDVSFLPNDASEKLLGLEDDVSYRELAAVYVDVEPGKVDYQGSSELEALRERAEADLARKSRDEPDPARRSRLLTLYGVMTLDSRPSDDGEREAVVREAASAFQAAIDLDPSNVDAMTNLEAVLDRHGELLRG
jgi:hypothetical protein